MSTTFTWYIEWMSCTPTEGSYTDVVITAGWRCNGVQDTYKGTILGAASFSTPEGAFTPYEQLTQAQVLGWVWASGVDQVAVEANVQSQIDNEINPPVVQLPLPWIAPTA
jgi:hypothetical protein